MQAIVLSGGVGSRLWPISTKTRPKPFIVLDDGKSLIQKAFIRASNIDDVQNITTVTHKNLYSQTKNEYEKISHLVKAQITSNFILEPFSKNTAPAIAAAALHIDQYYGNDELMLVLPADHIIFNQDAFENTIKKVKKLATNGALVTFGIKPDRAETSYGYMEYSGNNVLNFIEKPSIELSTEYLSKGNFLWNSGMFCFSAGSILKEMTKYCPNILYNIRYDVSWQEKIDNHKMEIDPFTFNFVPEQSIDYAIMEKSNKIAVVPCDIGWQDVGTWEALSNLTPADSNGNRIKGNVELHDVSNCYIENDGQPVGAVGVKDLAIISTKNGLLVTHKQSSEAVRNIYYKFHKNIANIQRFFWGTIEEIQSGAKTKINQITINPRSILHVTKYIIYPATCIVTSGIAKFSINGIFYNISINESQYITNQDFVSISNEKNFPLVIITVQPNIYFSEKIYNTKN